MTEQAGVWLDAETAQIVREALVIMEGVYERPAIEARGRLALAALDAAEARSGEDDARLAAIAASIRPDTLVSLHPDDAMWLVRRARVAAATASTEQENE
jgi:hypothetical protein